MQGVIDVKQIFVLPLATQAGVEGQQRQRKQAVPLDVAAHSQKAQTHSGAQYLLRLADAQGDEHRQQNALESVFDGKLRQMHGQYGADPVYPRQSQEKQHTGYGVFLFLHILQCIDQNNGKGEGHQNALVQHPPHKVIHKLQRQSKTCHKPQIFCFVSGIVAALSDHKSIDWHRNPSDDPQDPVLGQQVRANMVDGHSDKRNELELIARKSPSVFCHSRKPPFTFYEWCHYTPFLGKKQPLRIGSPDGYDIARPPLAKKQKNFLKGLPFL